MPPSATASLRDNFAAWAQGSKPSNHNTTGAIIDSVAICMVRNEQDIIEPFLRHTASLVDLVVVMDNASTDKTRVIITQTARALGNVVVTDLPDQGYNQSETMTRALQHVQSTVMADFVFFLDADEFLDAPSKDALLAPLKRLKPLEVGLLPWRTYVPDSSKAEDVFLDPLDRLTLRRTKEEPQYYKAVLRMAGGFDASLVVTQGNHKIRNGKGRKLTTHRIDDLALLHFPLRSIDQMHAKGTIGWEANTRRTNFRAKSGEADQWKRLHDLTDKAAAPLTAQTLQEEALRYAQNDGVQSQNPTSDPHGISIKRSFSSGAFGDPEALIAAARGLAKDNASRFILPDAPKPSDTETDVSNAFEGNWHWDYLFLDEPPIRFALERFAPTSILDLGCGNGLYPALYAHLGVTDVLGVDGLLPQATVLDESQYTMADLQKPFDVGRQFDLVVCLEVVEHIHPETTDILIDSIARHAQGQILFSMAQVGQPGNGHINCKNIDEVLDIWAQRGWQPNLPATLGLRALSSMSWFRSNILLLEQTGETGETGETFASKALKAIGAFEYKWYRQPPGQRSAAFGEAYPKVPKAYGKVAPFKSG